MESDYDVLFNITTIVPLPQYAHLYISTNFINEYKYEAKKDSSENAILFQPAYFAVLPEHPSNYHNNEKPVLLEIIKVYNQGIIQRIYFYAWNTGEVLSFIQTT